jgi:hypothetical protein
MFAFEMRPRVQGAIAMTTEPTPPGTDTLPAEGAPASMDHSDGNEPKKPEKRFLCSWFYEAMHEHWTEEGLEEAGLAYAFVRHSPRLKLVKTAPVASLTPEESLLVLQKGDPNGPIVLECDRSPPYLFTVAKSASAPADEPAPSGED